MKHSLSEEQASRYQRNINLNEIGEKGQIKLLNGSVLVIGAGGIGSSAIFYLAAAGVGHIGIADGDKVEISNLQRQILHFKDDIGKKKIVSAKNKLSLFEPDIKVSCFDLFVDEGSIKDIASKFDFVIDATDNFTSKFLINDCCIKAEKAFSHGGISGFCGQTITVLPGKTACFRCIFGERPEGSLLPERSQSGPLATVPGILGCIQATEAIKYILGREDMLTDSLLTFDVLKMSFRKVPVQKDPECLACGKLKLS